MTNEGPDQAFPNKQMPVQSQNQRTDFLLSKHVSGIGKYHRPLNRTGVVSERRGERKPFPMFNQCVLLLLLYRYIFKQSKAQGLGGKNTAASQN